VLEERRLGPSFEGEAGRRDELGILENLSTTPYGFLVKSSKSLGMIDAVSGGGLLPPGSTS